MNFVIIGAGRMAGEYVKVLTAMNHYVDSIFNSKTYSIEKISANIDAIVAAVTWTETEKIIEPLIELGIPMLVEKPVCLTSKRMKEVIARHNTDHVMVGYNRRFYPFIEKIKKELKHNILISIEVNLPEKLNRYKQIGVQKLDKYPLLYSACHVMDLLIYLTGEQVVIKTFYETWLHAINAIWIAGGYGIVHFQANFNTPSIPRITFNFQNKIIELKPIEQYYEITDTTYASQANLNVLIKEGKYFKPGIYEQMEYFIKKYVEKQNIKQIGCTMQEALKVIQLSEQLTRRK